MGFFEESTKLDFRQKLKKNVDKNMVTLRPNTCGVWTSVIIDIEGYYMAAYMLQCALGSHMPNCFSEKII